MERNQFSPTEQARLTHVIHQEAVNQVVSLGLPETKVTGAIATVGEAKPVNAVDTSRPIDVIGGLGVAVAIAAGNHIARKHLRETAKSYLQKM